jgi:hypothetical protein
VFGCLLSPRSLDSPKIFLAHKQISFSIIFDGVELISSSTIALAAYLKSWALVVSIIAARFMVYQHHFLLEALTRVNNNTFPF